MNFMNLVLTGLRGAGKTTIGQLLARKLNRPFLDLDQEIEKAHGQNIANIVKKHGWDYFRDLEHEACKKVGGLNNYIIATGGGTLMFERNYRLFQKNSHIILLTCHLNKIAQRIGNCQNRPSLTGQKNFIEELEDIWKKRKNKYYKIANLIIDTTNKTIEEVANEILKIVK